jgi:hypothetical protein
MLLWYFWHPREVWLLSKEGEVVCNVTVHKTGLSLRNWENPKEFPLLRAERQGRSLIARLRTEKPKYHTYNSRHAAPLVDICERKSRNTTNITHGMTQIIILFTSFWVSKMYCHGLSTFLAELVAFGIGKVEILQYYAEPLQHWSF